VQKSVEAGYYLYHTRTVEYTENLFMFFVLTHDYSKSDA